MVVFPLTFSLAFGVVVPIPTLPVELIVVEIVPFVAKCIEYAPCTESTPE